MINGSERVIVGLEDLSYNKIIVDSEETAGTLNYKAKVYSSIVGYRAKLEVIYLSLMARLWQRYLVLQLIFH